MQTKMIHLRLPATNTQSQRTRNRTRTAWLIEKYVHKEQRERYYEHTHNFFVVTQMLHIIQIH